MIPWEWNTTAQERAARFACDGYLDLDTPVRRLTRAITITAPPPTVFGWLCQLKVAAYSYDWLNNRGRRSPRRLTPGQSGSPPASRSWCSSWSSSSRGKA